jgi:hypothetical protein
MTTNSGEIISLYRQADLGDRLSIFLQFRELRDDFLEIDQKETDWMATTSAHDSLAVCEEA